MKTEDGSHREFELGTFELSSDRLVVSDPGYDLDDMERGCGVVLTNSLSGRWHASVMLGRIPATTSELCMQLCAWHENASPNGHWVAHEKTIGVDHGQAGIYDLAHFGDASIVPADVKWTFQIPKTMSWEEAERYLPAEQWELMKKHRARFSPMTVTVRTDERGPAMPDNLWYSYCCEHTAGEKHGAVFPFGVVTNAGIGDGGYSLETAMDESLSIVGVRITFLTDEELARLGVPDDWTKSGPGLV
jgi:hypothetical protein